MKYLFAAVLALGTVASFGAAEAAQGCGPGWARGPYGRCQPIRRAVVVRPAPVVVVRPPARTVVVRPGRVCPYGTVWRYGRCRAY
ncbi:GCG_CRPN prefix-to-repeats domain-containing protein [Bradyrhizobium sp. RDI18]|uniref:GCG_CRPN prefix-to-repeats domain-containing protein n=1 Tax=Bradyrhizobium sp. RDI18 TaxID=3367400 RepID=UPI003715BF4F